MKKIFRFFKLPKISLDSILVVLVFILIGSGVLINVIQQRAVDQSKLPSKVEDDRSFQRWVTNLRNNDLVVEADAFNLIEENEIYNTKWMRVNSLDVEEEKIKFEKILEEHKNLKHVVFSPSDREFIDFRHEERDIGPSDKPFAANEVRFYGQKEDKVIDARILDCSVRANCYFDRAYFLSNDLFVITEFSRDIDKKDTQTPECLISDICTYTVKLHLIDLINNQRLVYESNSFDINLAELIPEL